MNLRGRLAGPGLAGHAAALAAGALLPGAFAPFDAWLLALACPLALLALLARLPPGAAMARAWCFGLGMFGTGASWNASVPIAAVGTWPQITTIGTESAAQSRTGVTVLVAPGPEVTMQTPTRPLARA